MNKIDRIVAKIALPLVVGSLSALTAGVLFYEFHWRPSRYPPDAKVFNITFMGTDRWTLNRIGSWNYWRKGLGDLREIRVRQGDKVFLRLMSSDNTHGFAFPAYGISGIRVKPGQVKEIEFTADKAGHFSIFCDIYCGPTHSDMRAKFIVEPAPGVLSAAAPTNPVIRGHQVFKNFGCYHCHGEEGKGGVINLNAQTGEEVPGLMGVAEGYTDKELKKIILKGVLHVAKKNADGPAPLLYMPPWSGMFAEGDLDDVVAYLKSLLPPDADDDW